MSFSFIEFFVRLTGKMSTYTGFQGAFEFKDGVSVRKLHRGEVEVLPVIGLKCEAIDDEGEAVFEVIPGQVPMPGEAIDEVRAKFIASRPRGEEKVKSAPIEVEAPKSVVDPTDDDSDDDTPEVEGKYTQEQLEKIADKTGLKGLREVGEKVGAKGKSIPDLIERILKAQG